MGTVRLHGDATRFLTEYDDERRHVTDQKTDELDERL